MRDIREFARRKLPHFVSVYRFMKRHYEAHWLRGMTVEQVFTDIYQQNKWDSPTSVSGVGSELDQTKAVRRDLPILLRRLAVTTMLDIPCGDWLWMNRLHLEAIGYIGADIVTEIVEENQRLYSRPNVRFMRLNLIVDPLPKVDLVLCRDCLMHFSIDDVFRALKNICVSGSTYLLTTTFPSRRRNQRIATGQWQPINLEAEPFRLPKPLQTIVEENRLQAGMYPDKSLGLWEVDQVRQVVGGQSRP